MRKILFLMIFALIMAGCKSREEKVAEVIKQEMFKTLYDFESYEPIETKIDSAFTSIYTDTLALLYANEVSEMFNELDDAKMEYENANVDYIITGRGGPLKKPNEEIPNIPIASGISITSEEEYHDAKKKGFHLLPQVSFKFAAGQTQLINVTEDITRYWYLPDCKDCEGVAQVVGRSMSPTLPSGCWVALKKYTLPHENPNMIPFGNIFGIVVEDKETGEYHGHIKVLRRYKEQ